MHETYLKPKGLRRGIKSLHVGATVYLYDENRRGYRPNKAGRAIGDSIDHEHFVPKVIVGETPRSWILSGLDQKRFSKTDPDFYTLEEMGIAVYVRQMASVAGAYVSQLKDAELLRSIIAVFPDNWNTRSR